MRRNFGEAIGNGGGITRLKPRRTVDWERVWRATLAVVLLGVMAFSFGVSSGWWI